MSVVHNSLDYFVMAFTSISFAIREWQRLMRAAMKQLNLSARTYHRNLKLARTLADLAGSEGIQSVHLAQALHYRQKLMMR